MGVLVLHPHTIHGVLQILQSINYYSCESLQQCVYNENIQGLQVSVIVQGKVWNSKYEPDL